MSIKGFSSSGSCGHFVQRSGTILAISAEGHPRNIFCEINLKSVSWSRRRCHLKAFLFLALRPFCSVEGNNFSNFGSGLPKEHFCEIILKSCHWSRRRCHLKVFLFLALAAILISGVEQF